MRVKPGIYRPLLIISFIAVNALIIYGLASTWSFLNTGADKSTILHITAEIESAYRPKFNWTLEGQEGRDLEKQTLKDIERDYKSAWYVRYNALASNNPYGLGDYYTDDAQKFLFNLLDGNRSQNVFFRGTSITHNPEFLFYSLDGKLVVFNDMNVETFEETYKSGELVFSGIDVSSYQVTMLLEDGFWRIRQLVKIEGSHQAKSENSVFTKEQIQKIRGINYYTKEHPWEMFGKNFDQKQIEADFKLIKEMSFNSVRIFVPYEEFGGANVQEEYLEQLKSLLDIAQNHDIKVMITLFDFYGNYDVLDWTLTNRHAETVVNSVKDHPAIFSWGIKNEPDLDFESRGKDKVIAWLTNMTKQVRIWDSTHPITIGWSTPESASELMDEVDYVSFHYYGDADNFQESYLQLKSEVEDKALVLQEYGFSSYSGIWNGFTNSENNQKKYLTEIQQVIEKENIPYYFWTLYDFEKVPSKVAGRLPWRKAKQKHFGIIDTQEKPKPSHDIFPKK